METKVFATGPLEPQLTPTNNAIALKRGELFLELSNRSTISANYKPLEREMQDHVA